MILNYIHWNVDPEIFSLGFLHVRYYGLCFAIAFMLGYYILEKMFKSENINEDWLEKLFMYVVIATIVGARLGHVFFYGWDYYSQNLGDIIKIWEGGLASHGGAIGILVALYFYSKKVTKKSMIWTLDRLVIPVALAAMFIRLGNLMNSEIYGHATDVPWAFQFITNMHAWTNGAEPIYSAPSHPTQIYEALCYLATFVIVFFTYWKTKAKEKQGLIFGIFLIGIFASRFFIEFVKNNQEEFEQDMALNMGQWLSIPFVLAGVYFIYNAVKKK
ncbi:prolipoprotein diacylglyceryl transferase [Carboxylicivirga linearis]|uniref:Phosphatidylglycerol--prolipoprotein diacylglyceryl transferase n=1 Tax=Carboxylicivirga linearis TaxID=1628157 RepID=A0ABS5JR66_9BACT|nr:prolipoprotein diacylglyceryl transferase [Carboxylicivirga linearis]MBS2097390.1 prolipoprotein diacylglyceryl transferase [Carboxylicivirga linearis]